MNEVAISIIQEYMEESLFAPEICWGRYYFTERSYSRWAANEILSRIIEQEYPTLPWNSFYKELKTPIDIIIEFMYELDESIKISDGKKTQDVFLIARETTVDILCLFL